MSHLRSLSSIYSHAFDESGGNPYQESSLAYEMHDLPLKDPSPAVSRPRWPDNRTSLQSGPLKPPAGPYGNTSMNDFNWYRPSDYTTRKWFLPMWVAIIVFFGLAVVFGSLFVVTKHKLDGQNANDLNGTVTMTVTTTFMQQTSTSVLLPTTTSPSTVPATTSSGPQAFCSMGKILDLPKASPPEAAYAIWTDFVTDNGTDLLKHLNSSCSAKGLHIQNFRAKELARQWTAENVNANFGHGPIWTSNMRFTFTLAGVNFNETESSDLQCVPEGILDAGGPPDPDFNHCQGGDGIPYRSGTSPFDEQPKSSPTEESVAQASCFAKRQTTDLVGPVDISIWTNYVTDNGTALEKNEISRCESLGFGNWTAVESTENCTAPDGTVWESSNKFGFILDQVSEHDPGSLHCVQQAILDGGGPNNTAFCSYQVPT